MGLEEITRAIKTFVGDRNAYVEILTGQAIAKILHFGPNIIAYPIGNLGNEAAINFGIRLLNGIGIPTDQGFLNEARRQGQNFHSLTALVFTGLANDEQQRAAQGLSQIVERTRALLAFYTASPQTPLIRIKWIDPKMGEVEFIRSAYRGIPHRHQLDPISEDFLQSCADAYIEDDQLYYFLEMLNHAYRLEDEKFRIARLFSVLEAIAGPINGQFKKNNPKVGSRTAIRFTLGYFIDWDIPRFTLLPSQDFDFDHIEIAGYVRDKIFHGGGSLDEKDVPVILRPGIRLLSQRPDMISHQLRKDCELEIKRWVTGESKAVQARAGVVFEIPKRDPLYDGKLLMKSYISSDRAPQSNIASVAAQIVSGEADIIRLGLHI